MVKKVILIGVELFFDYVFGWFILFSLGFFWDFFDVCCSLLNN